MKSFKNAWLIFLSFLIAYVSPAVAEPVEITSILQSSKGWNGAPLPEFGSGQAELRVVMFKIEPGAKTAIHVHPVNGAGYVLSGELTMYSTENTKADFSDPAKVKKIVLKAGDAWAEAVDVWHYGENNGKEDVKFLVIFSGTQGTPSTLSY